MNTPESQVAVSAIDAGIAKMGGVSAAGRILGVGASAVANWRMRGKVTPEYAPTFAKHGGVPLAVICPSVPWHDIPNEDRAA